MITEEHFFKAVKNNDLEEVKHIISMDIIFSQKLYETIIQKSCINDKYEMAKLLFTCNHIDPSFDRNYLIIECSARDHYNMVELLLEQEKVDPTDRKNAAIYIADLNMNYHICKLLFSDKRVRKTLQQNHEDIYGFMITQETKSKVSNF